MSKRRSTIIITFVLLLIMIPIGIQKAEAATSLADKKVYYISDYLPADCVLSANVYMMRRATILMGSDNWKHITNTAVRGIISGGGGNCNDVYFSYKYRDSKIGASFQGSHSKLKGNVKNKQEKIKKLLVQHPEGIVVWGSSNAIKGSNSPHAIIITSYKDGIFYAADSSHNANCQGNYWGNRGIERFSNTTIRNWNCLTDYWYLSNMNLSKPKYTAKFVNDGKTVRTDTVKFKKTDKGYRGTFTAPVQSKTGYDFKGWTVKKKSGDKSYTACNVSSEKNGWKWVDSSKAKNLRYYPNGHSFTYALSTADVPTWGVNPGDTLTLTANWEKHKYKITYKSGVNDGSVSKMPSNGSTVPYGESLILRNLSKPVREGYEFAGWKSSANGDIYQSSVRIYKDTTFTAQWKKVVRVESIDISGKDQLNAGDRTTYKVTITPAEAADKKVTWSVENGSGAATITSDGVMTAEEAGTVTVKAAADGKDASITVNILPARDGMISEKEYREKYEGNSDYQATPYYRYKTRSKDTVVSGKKSLSGYTLKETKQVSKTTGGWTTSEPKSGTTEGSDYSTVVSAESKAAYYSYAYYCKDKKICWKTNTGSHKGCSKTNKLLQVYSSKSLSGSGYKKDTSDASYVCPKTFSTSSPEKLGTVYLVKYDGKSGAFTTAAKTGHIYLWQSSTKPKTIYRATTTKVQYTHEKYTGWSEWSGWSDERESISDPNLKSEEVRYKVERVNSTDPEDYVSVPDVKGRSESEAKEILENAGLKVKIQYVKSEEEEGTVVSCSAEGKVLKGSTVVLEVATGFESGLVTKEEYESKYAGSNAYDAVPYYRYATRTKQTVTNGYKNYSGYTLEETKKVGTSYGAWSTSAPKTGTTDGSSYQTVVTKESKNAYYTYAYYCNCKKWSWKVTGGSHQGCSNTKNLLQVYSSKSLGSSGYKKDASDGSYTVTAKTLGVNAPGKLGTVYCMKYKGSAVNSFTTAAKTGQIYLWPSSSGTKTVYRPVTTKYQYIHSKWSEWSAWGEWTPEVRNTSDSLKKDTEIMYYVTKK